MSSATPDKTTPVSEHVSLWSDLLGSESLTQHYVEAAGVRTRVVEAGEGPPLVFVHGTGGHLEAYSRNIEALLARASASSPTTWPGTGSRTSRTATTRPTI